MHMSLREFLTCCLRGQNLAFCASFIFIVFISFLFAYALSIERQTVFKFRTPDHDWSKSSHVMHCWSCWSCVSCIFGCISITWARPLFPFLQRACKTPGNSTKIHLAFCQSNQGQDLQVILGCVLGIAKFRLLRPIAQDSTPVGGGFGTKLPKVLDSARTRYTAKMEWTRELRPVSYFLLVAIIVSVTCQFRKRTWCSTFKFSLGK